MSEQKPIGKRVGNNLYFHMSAIECNLPFFPNFFHLLVKHTTSVPPLNKFSVIKLHLKENIATFCECPDFFGSLNPTTYSWYRITWDSNTYEIINSKAAKYKQLRVYHDAYKMVSPNKYGIYVNQSREWEQRWRKRFAEAFHFKPKNIGFKDRFNCLLIHAGLPTIN